MPEKDKEVKKVLEAVEEGGGEDSLLKEDHDEKKIPNSSNDIEGESKAEKEVEKKEGDTGKKEEETNPEIQGDSEPLPAPAEEKTKEEGTQTAGETGTQTEGETKEEKKEEDKKELEAALEKKGSDKAGEASDEDKDAKAAGNGKAGPMIQVFSNKFSFEGLSKLFNFGGGGGNQEEKKEEAPQQPAAEEPKQEQKEESFTDKLLGRLKDAGSKVVDKALGAIEDRYLGKDGWENVKKDAKKVGNGIKSVGKAIAKGAKKVGGAIKKGFQAVGRGVKNVYRKVRYGSEKAKQMEKQDKFNEKKDALKKSIEQLKGKGELTEQEKAKKIRLQKQLSMMDGGKQRKQRRAQAKKEAGKAEETDMGESLNNLFGGQEDPQQEEEQGDAKGADSQALVLQSSAITEAGQEQQKSVGEKTDDRKAKIQRKIEMLEERARLDPDSRERCERIIEKFRQKLNE